MREVFFGRKPDYEILPMTISDSVAVSELHGQRFSRRWSDGEFESLLLQPNCFGFVASQTNAGIFRPQLAGFVLAREVAGEAEILSIAVQEKVGRSGFGWRLMLAAMREAHQKGGQSMFLEVDEGNTAAVALYRKLGFEVAGRRRAYYADAEGQRSAALVMKRDLD